MKDYALNKKILWLTRLFCELLRTCSSGQMEGAGGASVCAKCCRRLLDDGDGGFLGGLNAEKYMKMTGVSKATATRDLSEMVVRGQLWSLEVGKALRYYVNVPGWEHKK